MHLPKHPWLRYLCVVALWLPVTTSLWLISKPVMLDVLYFASNPLISHGFTQSKAHIEREGEIWMIGTAILLKEQPADKTRRLYQYLKIGSVFNFSLELPLLWAILLALAPRNWRGIFLGSVILLSMITLKLVMNLSLQIGELLESEAGSYVELLTENYQLLQTYPHALLIILQGGYVMVSLLTLLSPLFISYFLNPRTVQAIFLAGYLYRNSALKI